MNKQRCWTPKKYYIVEHSYPTNHPGTWSYKKVFHARYEAEDYLKSLLDEDSVELPKTEWDDAGPNWEILESWDIGDGDEIITLIVIDNEKGEE